MTDWRTFGTLRAAPAAMVVALHLLLAYTFSPGLPLSYICKCTENLDAFNIPARPTATNELLPTLIPTRTLASFNPPDHLPRPKWSSPPSTKLAFFIEPDGTPSDCMVLESTAEPRFNTTICDRITRQLRYRPGRSASGTVIRDRVVLRLTS